ncbi:hypothetical protein [Azospirillum sp. SYSU D00513]|uniref:hypothetical protein n=1 Tax=Azospirillum sp. SYSU D00513 TaxID=2812561 RepID=UPI001A95FCAE|nr:hypothetical protein [Azospirillum sp. SYSU D00513]
MSAHSLSIGPAYRRTLRWALAAAGGGLMLAVLGWWLQPQLFFQAWLLAFLLWTGLAAGCLTLLMAGHLLSDPWLEPVRDELEAGALTLPLLGLLGLPLLAGLPDLYPWAETGTGPMGPMRGHWLDQGGFVLRSTAYLGIWSALAWAITRPGRHHRRIAVIGLLLMLFTVTLAGLDWVMSLDPNWLSTLFGLAFGVTQTVAALAAALLAAQLRPDGALPRHAGGIAGALLALAGTTAYLWFVHFLVVWAANLPDEVGWYLDRGGAWLLLMPGIVVPAAALAVLILLPRWLRGRRKVLVAAGALLLAQHLAHMVWLVRPTAQQPVLHWLDAVSAMTFGALCLALFTRRLSGTTTRRSHDRL